MSTYTALCIGGPADGTWKTVEDRVFEVAEPVTLTFSVSDTLAIEEPFKRYQYRVESFAMFGFATEVAICEREFIGSTERHKAIMRALLQRDVAAQMGVL